VCPIVTNLSTFQWNCETDEDCVDDHHVCVNTGVVRTCVPAIYDEKDPDSTSVQIRNNSLLAFLWGKKALLSYISELPQIGDSRSVENDLKTPPEDVQEQLIEDKIGETVGIVKKEAEFSEEDDEKHPLPDRDIDMIASDKVKDPLITTETPDSRSIHHLIDNEDVEPYPVDVNLKSVGENASSEISPDSKDEVSDTAPVLSIEDKEEEKDAIPDPPRLEDDVVNETLHEDPSPMVDLNITMFMVHLGMCFPWDQEREEQSAKKTKVDEEEEKPVSLEFYSRQIIEEAEQIQNEPIPENRPDKKPVPNKSRFNFASFDAGAVILESSKGVHDPVNILVNSKLKYTLIPFHLKDKYFVIQLSEDIMVEEVVLLNIEHYSSNIKEVQISGSSKFPTENWTPLASFEAENTHNEINYSVSHTWVRYVRIVIRSTWGSHYYCTLTQIKIFGSTILQHASEEFKAKRASAQRVHKSLFKNNSSDPTTNYTGNEMNETDSTGSTSEELGHMANVFESITQHLSQLELNMSITASYVEKVISSRINELEKRFKDRKVSSEFEKAREEDLNSVIASLEASLGELKNEVTVGRLLMYNTVVFLVVLVTVQFLMMYCCFELKVPKPESLGRKVKVRNATAQTNLRAKKKTQKSDSPHPIEPNMPVAPTILVRSNSLPTRGELDVGPQVIQLYPTQKDIKSERSPKRQKDNEFDK